MTPSSEVPQNVEERLADIRARLAAAAPGPWRWSLTYEIALGEGRLAKHWCLNSPASEAKGQCIDGFLVLETTSPVDYGQRPLDETPNFALIAHAPSDLEWATAEIASLREELERVRGDRGELAALCRMLAEVGRIGSEHTSLAAKLGIFLDAAPEEPSPPRSRFDCVHELAENLARPDTRGEER